MCSLNNLDRGKRLSIQPKSPVVSTVFSPAMKRFLLSLSYEAVVLCGLRLVVLVDADDDLRTIGRQFVRRDLEVIGRRYVLVHAAGQIERRTVAGTEEAALPVGGQAGAGARSQVWCWRATQV